MQLEFAGAPTIAAPLPMVWRRLLDPHAVAAAAPSVDAVELIDDTHFKVMSGFGVGVLRLHFVLDVEFADIVEHTSASMHARGTATGSKVDLRTSIELREGRDGETHLQWRATALIHGMLATVGSRLLESAIGSLTTEFWDRFARQAAAANT